MSSLYGAPRPTKKLKSSGPDSSSLAFASHLTSLMSLPAKSSSRNPQENRKSSAKSQKEDIFSAHHRAKKQKSRESAAKGGKGEDETQAQIHRTAQELGGVDNDILHRSKRKMEEKARIYAAMKRGDYVDQRAARHGSSALGEALADERGPLVDFDRKWAEEGQQNQETSSDDDQDSEEEELVEYTDEFGRTRKGTRGQVARIQRQQRVAAAAQAELDEIRGRPVVGREDQTENSKIIFGDTVQTAAFNPDQTISEQMAALAAKRDRSLTPPPDLHYDASKEVRTKGVGFYQFSQDETMRQQEMDSLAAERAETERRTREREERRARKAREMEERRQILREKRTKKQADAFLQGLDLDNFVPAESEQASLE